MKISLFSNFNPKTLATWPVFLFVLAWSISTNLIDRVHHPEDMYLERMLAVVSGHLVMFIAVLVGVRLLGLLPQILQSLLMIPLIVLVSVMRGFTMWTLLAGFGIDGPESFNYRVLGAITNMGIPLLLSSVAVHRVRVYSEAKSKLLAENVRLSELRTIAQSQIKQDAEQQLEEVRSTVRQALAMQKLRTSADTMAAISKTIDDVVRPMVEEIESTSTELPREKSTNPTRLDWSEALLGALSAKFLMPLPVAITLCLASLVYLFSLKTPLQVSYLLIIIGIGSLALLSLTKIVVGKVTNFVPRWAEIIFFIFAVVGSGFLVGLATLIVTLTTNTPTSLLFVAPYFVTGVTILYALAASTQAQAKATNENLNDLRTTLAWEVARVASEQRQMKRAVASLLHGKLQSGLTSALMKLKMAEVSDSANLQQVTRVVRDEIGALIESLRLQDIKSDRSVNEIFDSIRQTWHGLAEITLDDVPALVSCHLEKDSVLMANMAEIAAELSFNSIKHGAANQIQFSVREVSKNTVQLMCADNGTLPAASGRIGLGTKLLDAFALEWSREVNRELPGTKTTVLLPFAPAKSI